MYVTLARKEELPENDVLTLKQVGANYMKLYVIKLLILCSGW
jgi:hypothetical protein